MFLCYQHTFCVWVHLWKTSILYCHLFSACFCYVELALNHPKVTTECFMIVCKIMNCDHFLFPTNTAWYLDFHTVWQRRNPVSASFPSSLLRKHPEGTVSYQYLKKKSCYLSYLVLWYQYQTIAMLSNRTTCNNYHNLLPISDIDLSSGKLWLTVSSAFLIWVSSTTW